MLILSLVPILFTFIAAEQEFLKYGEISLKKMVEMSKQAGVVTECRKSNMIALTFDDGIV